MLLLAGHGRPAGPAGGQYEADGPEDEVDNVVVVPCGYSGSCRADELELLMVIELELMVMVVVVVYDQTSRSVSDPPLAWHAVVSRLRLFPAS